MPIAHGTFQPLWPVILLWLIAISPGDGLAAQGAQAQSADVIRVLFLGNSAYVAYGGSLAPFKGFCAEVGISCQALSNFDVFGESEEGRVDWRWPGLAEDARLPKLLGREKFDFVVLWTRQYELADEARWESAVRGLRKVIEIIARSGATTVVPMPYIPPGNAGPLDRLELGYRRLLQELKGVDVDGRRVSIRFIPLGRFWADGVRQFGAKTWYADPYHGSRQAQYATGCLWFTFLLERDPRGLTFAKLPTDRDLAESERDDQANAELVDWTQRRVWELFLEFRAARY